jgi:Zn-dependent peptidase ImmA (M78 family)
MAGVDAFSQSFPHRPVVCLCADKGDRFRSRFDAAHELGHLVLHRDGEVMGAEAERQANEFASTFLLPRAEIAGYLPSRVKWDVLLELKQVWGVSMKALLMRSRSIGKLSESSFRRAMTLLVSRGWHVAEPGDFLGDEEPTMLTRACRLLETTDPVRRVRDIADALHVPEELVSELVGVEARSVLEVAAEGGGLPTAIVPKQARQ